MVVGVQADTQVVDADADVLAQAGRRLQGLHRLRHQLLVVVQEVLDVDLVLELLQLRALVLYGVENIAHAFQIVLHDRVQPLAVLQMASEITLLTTKRPHSS